MSAHSSPSATARSTAVICPPSRLIRENSFCFSLEISGNLSFHAFFRLAVLFLLTDTLGGYDITFLSGSENLLPNHHKDVCRIAVGTSLRKHSAAFRCRSSGCDSIAKSSLYRLTSASSTPPTT